MPRPTIVDVVQDAPDGDAAGLAVADAGGAAGAHAARQTRALIDHGRTHHKHSAATAVGAVAASVLGVLTAALVVGGSGSPHGLQTASPTLSGGAAATSGEGAAAGTPSGVGGATGSLGIPAPGAYTPSPVSTPC